jgi:hypothetical protein
MRTHKIYPVVGIKLINEKKKNLTIRAKEIDQR